MVVDVTISNYRRFADSHPLRLSLGSGISAFVGLNNSGKSSILKFFYEFRNAIGTLGSPSGGCVAAIRHQPQAINLLGVHDHNEVFCNLNQRDIAITFDFPEFQEVEAPRITKAVIFARRSDATFVVDLWTSLGQVPHEVRGFEQNLLLARDGQRVANPDTFF